MGIRRVGLDDALREHGVGESALNQASQVSSRLKVPLSEACRQVDGIEPMALIRTLSDLSGLPVVERVDLEQLEHDLVRSFPLAIAREYRMLPLYVVDGELVVGLSGLRGFSVIDDLQLLHGYPLRPVLVPADVLNEATNVAYDRASSSASDVLDDVDNEVEGEVDLSLDEAELLDDPNQAPIIRFVNAVLSQAIKERASDIHIEPYEKDLVVRYRIDGVLKEALRPPYKFKNTIVARIKIMAGLNIAEKRLPQDGRIRRKMMGREIDLRVSTVPIRHGERVVMRILEKGKVFSLDTLGMEGAVLDTFRGLIHRPHGILLVSGPTGSGKSTTLYSAITEINSPELNILTIEDPVEYEVAGIGQVQVNPKIELTFASALRSFLRQDPDVILVGEIRDSETANNAVQASLTGHLVFSTLHTNDAAGAFARLVDMGVEPFLVASSIIGVVAQRLVRRLCGTCKEAYKPSAEELRELGLTRKDVPGKVWKAVGCEECNHLGYTDRTGIYEFLPATDEVKRRVIANEDAGSIKKQAVMAGMRTLRDDGVLKVLAGVTTFEEVRRVTAEDAGED
jgi:general secretion pathway protein E